MEEYYLQLSDKKKGYIKSIGNSENLGDMIKLKAKRKIQPNQYMWIGVYINGILQRSI